jgi:hypothetical protein
MAQESRVTLAVCALVGESSGPSRTHFGKLSGAIGFHRIGWRLIVASQKRDPRKDPKAALGGALRQLRADAGFTQASAAAQIDGYGGDSLSKAETGAQVPTDDLYSRLLSLYKVTAREKTLLDVMLDTARNADPVIPESAELWLQMESEATNIHVWALDVMPGLLQTYDYAFAMFIKGGMEESRAATRATTRVKRSAILDGPDATRLTALIDEPLLHRKVGTLEVMVGELEHLLEIMGQPNVIIQVVRETDYFPGNDGQFEIAGGRAISDTVNMICVEDHTTTAPAMIDRATTLFDEIRSYALSAAESRALIQEALQRWKSQQ